MPAVNDPTSRAGHVHDRRRWRDRARAAGALLAALVVLASLAPSAQAATVPLGSAASFAVLAGSTVTNTGASVISGDVGVSPGSAVTGFGPGKVIPPSVIYRGGPVALKAQNDLTTAYNTAAGQSSTGAISTDLAGRTLSPGVYTATSSLALNGTLTLDAKGNPNAQFVFQAGSTLLVGTTTVSRVLLIDGAQAANVFWQVGSSATIGVGSAFAGNILALTSITMDTGATLNGRALARNGAVTLDGTAIDSPAAPLPPPPPPPPVGPGSGSCAVQNPGGLASSHGVALGESFTGDPAHGGTLIAAEWLQLGLRPGAETVRRQTADGIITTRTDVPCADGASASSSVLRPELREETIPSADGSIRATFSRDRGSRLGDPNIYQPSDLQDGVLLGRSSPAAAGPVSGLLQAWQRPPPGHGSSYERYDTPDGGATDSEWVDAATHLPLELRVRSGSARQTTYQTTYWTYDPNTIAPAALPAGFFELALPARAGQVGQEDYYPAGQLPGSVSESGGAAFGPLSLGASPTVGGHGLCLADASLYRFYEGGEGGSQDARITRTSADYALRAPGAACVPGQGGAGEPDLQVMTFASSSEYAAGHRQSFEHQPAVRIGSVSVRILPGREDTLGLAQIGQSTVVIRDSFPPARSPGAARAQILSLVSRLRGGSISAAQDSSSPSRGASVAAGAPTAPIDVRTANRRTTRADRPGNRCPTGCYESLTYGGWLFSGSTYDPSPENLALERPADNQRVDPVNVIWTGQRDATIDHVVANTARYWSRAPNLGRNYPPSGTMVFQPLCGYETGTSVFFRAVGDLPVRDDFGGFFPADPLYPPTLGLSRMTTGNCGNGYQIEMWDSRGLDSLHYGTVERSHHNDFVLAPIRHDHYDLSCALCRGTTADLPFDQARYAYQEIIRRRSPLEVENLWRIKGVLQVNPESEGYHYYYQPRPGQKLMAYSGYLSQIGVPRRTPPPPPPPHVGQREAAEFMPVLRFDSSEKWRPLNVEDFFAERRQHLCYAGHCTLLTSTAGLNRHRSRSAHIDVAGKDFKSQGDEATYHSPYPACTRGGLRDCDTGSKSAIYYRVTGPYGGYRYIDYWYFYRANYFYGSIDWHEGDWEGATIAPDPSGRTFDYAAFSQHGTYYAYLRDVLRCEDAPAASIPARGSCGTQSSPSGHRVDDFVANGDHANYTTPCSENVFAPPVHSCSQNANPLPILCGHCERGYDGTKRWGRAYDPAALLALPQPGPSSWATWPGSWGDPAPALPAFEGSGPQSPDNQTIRVACANLDNARGCTTGPRAAADGARPSSAPQTASSALSPGLAALSCSAWIGQGVSAAVCDPAALRAAVLHARLGSPGSTLVTEPGGEGWAAGAPGIAQYADPAPLRDGSLIRVRGAVRAGDELLLSVPGRRGQRRIASWIVRGSGGASIAGVRNLTFRLHVSGASGGAPRITLTGRPSAVRLIGQDG